MNTRIYEEKKKADQTGTKTNWFVWSLVKTECDKDLSSLASRKVRVCKVRSASSCGRKVQGSLRVISVEIKILHVFNYRLLEPFTVGHSMSLMQQTTCHAFSCFESYKKNIKAPEKVATTTHTGQLNKRLFSFPYHRLVRWKAASDLLIRSPQDQTRSIRQPGSWCWVASVSRALKKAGKLHISPGAVFMKQK